MMSTSTICPGAATLAALEEGGRDEGDGRNIPPIDCYWNFVFFMPPCLQKAQKRFVTYFKGIEGFNALLKGE
jgi:hypothetical protein